jgi:tripartite-type tricarboxylate transporter receptor subunit TctC
MARVLSDQLTTDLGQPFIVENRPGASGSIGMQALLSAPADGQTIMVTASNVVTETPLVVKMPMNPLKDIKPVAAVALSRLVLVGATNLPSGDFKAFVAYAKAHPHSLSYASYGIGTASHYSGVMLNQKAGLDLQHVPFQGAPPAIAQLMGGQIALMFDNIPNSKPMLEAGKLRAYAVASKTRSPSLPQVPTLAELGYPDIDFANWLGVMVSAAVPPETTERIRAAVVKAGASPKVQQRLRELGFESVPAQSMDELRAALRVEYDRNAAIVKANNIRISD